jgi:hypothetical protein
MHTRIAALAVALLPALAATPAAAVPTELNVRVEGATQTLFEGPLLTDGHPVRASSDGVDRRCDSTNNGMSETPGPTPTAATVDAMKIVGETFDGQWYPGFDDYFIERWGPDAQDPDVFGYWGILVNGSFTPVGGCQFANAAADDVLWVYDAFQSRPLLRLATADDPSATPAAPLPTAFVDEGEPLTVEVERYAGAMDGGPQNVAPVAGVTVAPVATDPTKGFQEVLTDDPTAVTTTGDGSVAIVFDTPGWHRLKATGDATYVRSNRLDVCVRPEGGGDCGPLPADALVRSVPEPETPPPGDGPGTGSGDPPAGDPAPGTAKPSTARVRMTSPTVHVDRKRGRVKVRWRVLERGVGVRRWTIAARRVGGKPARFRGLARGHTKTSASLSLRRGVKFALRLTVVDNRGRRTTRPLGRVTIPFGKADAR